jgi:hypothetical protein
MIKIIQEDSLPASSSDVASLLRFADNKEYQDIAKNPEKFGWHKKDSDSNEDETDDTSMETANRIIKKALGYSASSSSLVSVNSENNKDSCSYYYIVDKLEKDYGSKDVTDSDNMYGTYNSIDTPYGPVIYYHNNGYSNLTMPKKTAAALADHFEND